MAPGTTDGRAWTRWLLGVFLTACVLVTVGCVWWGVVEMRRSFDRPETDYDRAERLAGLHYKQHPGKGRYYIPTAAALSRAADGSPVAYLHFGIAGGDSANIDDFLHTYDLPKPGSVAPLPQDLRAALPGDEPAEGLLLPVGQAGRQIFVVMRPSDVEGAGDVYVRATGR
ncbi:hypothetical protein BOQ63_034965 [Streptomyces viridifaciens]|nr:hypothetical protein BOQ63_034965 [Streptomyces viridifaciens]